MGVFGGKCNKNENFAQTAILPNLYFQNNALSIPLNNDFNFTSKPLVITFWLYITNRNNFIAFQAGDITITFRLGTNSILVCNKELYLEYENAKNKWNHYAFIFNKNEIKYYFNGIYTIYEPNVSTCIINTNLSNKQLRLFNGYSGIVSNFSISDTIDNLASVTYPVPTSQPSPLSSLLFLSFSNKNILINIGKSKNITINNTNNNQKVLNISDSPFNSNNGIISNGTLVFRGKSYVEYQLNGEFIFTNKPLIIEFWLYIVDFSNRLKNNFSAIKIGRDDLISFRLSTNEILTACGPSVLTTSYDEVKDKWSHFTFVFHNKQVKYYLNGTLKGQINTCNYNLNLWNKRIKMFDGFNGYMSNLRITNSFPTGNTFSSTEYPVPTSEFLPGSGLLVVSSFYDWKSLINIGTSKTSNTDANITKLNNVTPFNSTKLNIIPV